MRKMLLLLTVMPFLMLLGFCQNAHADTLSCDTNDFIEGVINFSQRTITLVEVNRNGVKGSMNFTISKGYLRFHFEAEHLKSGERYTLIYYPKGTVVPQLQILGSGKTGGNGHLQIKNTITISKLNLNNSSIDSENPLSKFNPMLILSSNLDSTKRLCMTKWSSAEYLFAESIIWSSNGIPTFNSLIISIGMFTPFLDITLGIDFVPIDISAWNSTAKECNEENCSSDRSVCYARCIEKDAMSILTSSSCLQSCNFQCNDSESCNTCYASCPNEFDITTCNDACDLTYSTCTGNMSERTLTN